MFQKTIWTHNRVFLCQIYTSGFLTSFGKFFSIVALHDVMKGGTPYMGISPGRACPCTHRPEQEQERAHQRFIQHHCTGLAREECLQRSVFGCKGNIPLFSFPKNPELREQWMQFVFRGSNGVSQVCLLTNIL